MITKKLAYRKGCRPVLYLSNNEIKTLKIPEDELWRVVRLEVTGDKWISWMHEREFRYLLYQGVFVESLYDVFKVLGGATAILIALFTFISKIWISRIVEKNKYDLQIKLNAIQHDLDASNKNLYAKIQNSIFISQRQLEHEYEIYQSVWASLIELKNATMRLRPAMDYVDPKKSREEIIRERLCVFGEKYNQFATLIEQNKPFYPQSIFNVIDSVCEKCRHESIDSEYIERKNSEYYKEAQENRKEIISLIDDVCTTIRSRLAEVRVK